MIHPSHIPEKYLRFLVPTDVLHGYFYSHHSAFLSRNKIQEKVIIPEFVQHPPSDRKANVVSPHGRYLLAVLRAIARLTFIPLYVSSLLTHMYTRLHTSRHTL